MSTVPESLFDVDPPEGKDRELADKMVRTFLGSKMEPKKTAKTISDSVWNKLLREVDVWMRTGDWRNAGPRHLVALYEMLHTRIYEVKPVELGPTTRLHATGAAARLLDREFDGNISEMVDFMRWTWMREEDREKWRRANNRDGGHIGWKYQFCGTILTEYRLANVRKAAR